MGRPDGEPICHRRKGGESVGWVEGLSMPVSLEGLQGEGEREVPGKHLSVLFNPAKDLYTQGHGKSIKRRPGTGLRDIMGDSRVASEVRRPARCVAVLTCTTARCTHTMPAPSGAATRAGRDRSPWS